MRKFQSFNPVAIRRAGGFISTKVAALMVAVSSMFATGLAMAAASGPGDAIAAELADGPSQLGIVFGAVAVLIGLLILWAYMKRAR